MGNKNSGELWESVYKLQHKEFLAFNDMLTEKIQMGELDSSDKKAIQKAKDDFHAGIAADRTKLNEAIWATYADKGKMGQSEVRGIVKDALTHGKTHLPPVLVALVEVEAMRSPEVQKQSSALMTDREARPLLEKSLARIRKDCGERVSNSLNELLSDVNSIGDKLLLRLTIPADTKDVKEAKLDPKAVVKQETFMKLFHAANQDAVGMKELIQSVLAQFTNFLEIELRNIPERVIKKLEADDEERERAASASENPKKA